MTLTRTFPDTATYDHRFDVDAANACRSASVVFFSRGRVEMFDLAPGRRVVIGRSDPADVRLDDSSLSRRHAEIRNDEGRLWVRDLGSRNGTFLHGERVESDTEVRSGDELHLGGIVAQIRVTSVRADVRGIDTQDQFLARLEDEVIRARTFGRSVTLMMLRSADQDRGHIRNWCAAVRHALRPVDRMAVYGTTSALVMLPEVGLSEARQKALDVMAQCAASRLTCAIAAYPQTGRTHDELLTVVHELSSRATIAQPLLAADDSQRTAPPETDSNIVIVAPSMKRLYDLLHRAAPTDAPVLVLGETGSGKELVAVALHQNSSRRTRALRIVNCAAMPPTLTESLLFGHERGAFTGADRRTKGVFEEADGGTIFLDEVGELSPSAQAALLRILENKRFTRLGSSQEIEVDVRIVAATHRDLQAMVAAKHFREDLYYRLDTLTLRVPPLRDRAEDIQPLCELFLRRASRDWGVPITGIDPDALDRLKSHAWPGNVRELRNVIERAVIVGGGPEVLLEHLPESMRVQDASLRNAESEPPRVEKLAAPAPTIETLPSADLPYRERIKSLEAAVIRDALLKNGGSRVRAAKALGIPLRTLMTKIKLLDVKG